VLVILHLDNLNQLKIILKVDHNFWLEIIGLYDMYLYNDLYYHTIVKLLYKIKSKKSTVICQNKIFKKLINLVELKKRH